MNSARPWIWDTSALRALLILGPVIIGVDSSLIRTESDFRLVKLSKLDRRSISSHRSVDPSSAKRRRLEQPDKHCAQPAA
jgi:hypothetical protein